MKVQTYTSSVRVPDYRKPLGGPFELTGDYLAEQFKYVTAITLTFPDGSEVIYEVCP